MQLFSLAQWDLESFIHGNLRTADVPKYQGLNIGNMYILYDCIIHLCL